MSLKIKIHFPQQAPCKCSKLAQRRPFPALYAHVSRSHMMTPTANPGAILLYSIRPYATHPKLSPSTFSIACCSSCGTTGSSSAVLSDCDATPLCVHSSRDVHAGQLLEQQFGRVGYVDLRYLGLVAAGPAFELVLLETPVEIVTSRSVMPIYSMR